MAENNRPNKIKRDRKMAAEIIPFFFFWDCSRRYGRAQRPAAAINLLFYYSPPALFLAGQKQRQAQKKGKIIKARSKIMADFSFMFGRAFVFLFLRSFHSLLPGHLLRRLNIFTGVILLFHSASFYSRCRRSFSIA